MSLKIYKTKFQNLQTLQNRKNLHVRGKKMFIISEKMCIFAPEDGEKANKLDLKQ